MKRALPGHLWSVFACRVLGHRPCYRSEGVTLKWSCARGCGAEGEKRYASPGHARRYADAFNREDRADIGRRPLLSLLTLNLFRRLARPR